MGVSLTDLAGTIRAAFYGEEVMRLQRGRHEVKLMVRYPQAERRTLATLDEIRVTSPDGVKRPIGELADVAVERGYSEINRLGQKRAITVTADIDVAKTTLTSSHVIADMERRLMPSFAADYPAVRVRWEGQREQSNESLRSLGVGFVVALFAMFVLLTMEFKSYFQPFLILAAIPFGIAGAVFGHAVMGMPLTLFSMFGLVALAGVVVNDSICLIDFINLRVREGHPLRAALRDLGATTFLVTHDHEVATGLASRIGFLEGGRLVQVGTAEELWRSPAHLAVATGFGPEPMIAIPDGTGTLAFRPSAARIGEPAGDTVRHFPLRAVETEFGGDLSRHRITLADASGTVLLLPATGDAVHRTLLVPIEAIHRFGPDGRRLGPPVC
jgi:hypothetical protein